MAVYNGQEYIGDALDSILKQSFRDFEFIVVNDGSLDGTARILQRYAQLDERLLVLHQENHGVIAALNRGCRLARGTYIARMDADDVSVPGRFEMQVDFLDRHPTVAVVGGAIRFINTTGDVIGERRYPLEDRQIKKALRENNCCLMHPAIMMRKNAFDTTGGYRSSFVHAEDNDLFLRLADRGEMANLSDVLLYYRLHARQVSTRHIRQQVLSGLAAEAVARIRRETGQEPTLPPDGVTAESLVSLAVGRDCATETLIRRYVAWAGSMRAAGELGVAEQLLREALVLSHAEASLGWLPEIHVEFAKCQYLQGHPPRALLSLARATALRPRAAPSFIRYVWLAFRRQGSQLHRREV